MESPLNLSFVLAAHLAAATWMGVIYLFVHWIHYPMFAQLREDTYHSTHAFHCRRITWLVAPGLILEAVTTFLVCWQLPDSVQVWGWASCFLLFANVCCTFFVAVPAHNRLATGFNEAVLHHLLQINRVRCILAVMRIGVGGGICLFVT